MIMPIERIHDDSPHRLHLDFIAPLLERIPQLHTRRRPMGSGHSALERVVVDDGVVWRCLHGGTSGWMDENGFDIPPATPLGWIMLCYTCHPKVRPPCLGNPEARRLRKQPRATVQ